MTNQLLIVEHDERLRRAFETLGHQVLAISDMDSSELAAAIGNAGIFQQVCINLHLRYFGAPHTMAFPGLLSALEHFRKNATTQYILYSVLPESCLNDVPLPAPNFSVLSMPQLFAKVSGYPFAAR